MATLKVTGVDEAVVRFVQERANALHFKGQAEYLRSLIREDMARASSERKSRIDQILGPIHALSESKDLSDEELSEVIQKARNEVWNLKKASE